MLFAVPMSILQRIFTVTMVPSRPPPRICTDYFCCSAAPEYRFLRLYFSVDIFVLLLAVLVSFKIARVRIVSVDPVGARSVGEAAPPPTASSKDP